MVSGTGGVFSACPFVQEAFSFALSEKGLYYQSPSMNGARGAVLIAKHYFGSHHEKLSYERKVKLNA